MRRSLVLKKEPHHFETKGLVQDAWFGHKPRPARAKDATKDTALRLFHFKILKIIICPTSILLGKMKIKNTDMCEYRDCQEFIEHFFFNIKKSMKLLKECRAVHTHDDITARKNHNQRKTRPI